MKKKIISASILPFVFLIGIGGFFSYIHTKILYTEHEKLWEYRRLQPDVIPSTGTLHALAVGHDTTYADILWIQLIQFIGDNIRDARYLDFTHQILTRIHALHPRFARAYEIDLLFLPTVSFRDDSLTIIKKEKRLQEGLKYYEEVIPKICDLNKVRQIDSLPFGSELWSREDLKNPCLSGYVPYYLAGRYNTEFFDRDKAVRYYKIASMHDEAPGAARFLGVIALSSNGNYRDGALTFLLMAVDSYDEAPFLCQNVAHRIARDIGSDIEWSDTWIHDIIKDEKSLSSPRDTNNPLVLSNNTCYENIQRGIKQIYLGYITKTMEKYPDISTEQEILDLGIMNTIPKIQTQSGFTIIRTNNVWKYSQVFSE